MNKTKYTWKVTNLWQKLSINQQEQLREILWGLDQDFILEFAWKIAFILVSWNSSDDAIRYIDKQLEIKWIDYNDRFTYIPNINDAFYDSIVKVKQRLYSILSK